jgi:hypothetical protein
MSFEKQIENLELRLRTAIEHVSQAESDLNLIRLKAGLPTAKPVSPAPGSVPAGASFPLIFGRKN